MPIESWLSKPVLLFHLAYSMGCLTILDSIGIRLGVRIDHNAVVITPFKRIFSCVPRADVTHQALTHLSLGSSVTGAFPNWCSCLNIDPQIRHEYESYWDGNRLRHAVPRTKVSQRLIASALNENASRMSFFQNWISVQGGGGPKS